MNFDREMAEIVQRHMKDEYGWEPHISELLDKPRHERVWTWWRALAYFKMKNHYAGLDEAPEGLKWITIITDEAMMNYQWNGIYEYVQQLTKEDCKKIYGE